MNARMTYSIISSVSDGIDSTTRGETGDDLDEFWVLNNIFCLIYSFMCSFLVF